MGRLKLRKMAHNARICAELLTPDTLQPPISAFKVARDQVPESAGVYLVATREENLYVGEALNLQERFRVQFRSERKGAWKKICSIGELQVRLFTTEANSVDLLAYQSILVRRYTPRLNSEMLATA